MTETWIDACSLKELQTKSRLLVRHQGRQIVLFSSAGTDTDAIFACNNRCPHEGYPLSEGSLDERCVLTCNWHNWKFDLQTGANLYGGDRLPVYATKIENERVWIDITEPPLEQRRAEIMANLRAAFADHDYERIARELGRMRLLGVALSDAVAAAIEWSYERLEFGWTHAYAGAADWLRLYAEYSDDEESRLICVLEAIAHIAYDVLREKQYPYPGNTLPYAENAFLNAIEDENETQAIAILRGAFVNGMGIDELEQVLSRAALAHYNDFGHSLIYVGKARQLVAYLGQSVEKPLLLSLTRSLIFASREDRIPEFRAYAGALTEWRPITEQRAGQSIAIETTENTPDWRDFSALNIERVLQKTLACRGQPYTAIFAALLAANAAHMLAFDLSYQEHIDGNIADNVGWLSFTHSITFANAVRSQCQKFPELWPAGLLQMACFCGRNRPFTDYQQSGDSWHIDDPETFFSDTVTQLFDHGKEEYIVSVHLLKTVLAARDEIRAAQGDELVRLLAASLNRFLHSPLKRKHMRRTARQAMKFVARDA